MSQRARRQVLIAASGAAIAAGVYVLGPGRTVMERASLATAYAGLLLMTASLAIGPIEVLRGRRPPPSTYLRRDISIFAGVFALIHVVVGLQVHLGGAIASYFLDPARGMAVRTDTFGIANHTGLLAALVLVMLLGLSNNKSLRALKASRWKSLQRWAYAAALLVLVHGILYQVLEAQVPVLVLIFGVAAMLALVLQLSGFLRRRRRATHKQTA